MLVVDCVVEMVVVAAVAVAAPVAVAQPVGMQPMGMVKGGYQPAPMTGAQPGVEMMPPGAEAQVLSATVVLATHTLVIPPSAMPGAVNTLTLPDGRQVQVQLPPNAFPGTTLQIQA